MKLAFALMAAINAGFTKTEARRASWRPRSDSRFSLADSESGTAAIRPAWATKQKATPPPPRHPCGSSSRAVAAAPTPNSLGRRAARNRQGRQRDRSGDLAATRRARRRNQGTQRRPKRAHLPDRRRAGAAGPAGQNAQEHRPAAQRGGLRRALRRQPAPGLHRPSNRHRLDYGGDRDANRPARDRRPPPALRPAHPRLRLAAYRGRQDQDRDHPLPHASQRPRDLPRPQRRPSARQHAAPAGPIVAIPYGAGPIGRSVTRT